MDEDRFTHDKAAIRAELERRARARQFITYGDAARLIGRPSGGLGRILNTIRIEEIAARRPDLTSLVVAIKTGLPAYLGPGEDARERAIAAQEAVFRAWAPK